MPSPRINRVFPNPMSHFMTATADLRVYVLRAFGFASQVHLPLHPQNFPVVSDFFALLTTSVVFSISASKQLYYKANRDCMQDIKKAVVRMIFDFCRNKQNTTSVYI